VSELLKDKDLDGLQGCDLGPKDWELAKHVSQGLAVSYSHFPIFVSN
jgi:hypothetical protein